MTAQPSPLFLAALVAIAALGPLTMQIFVPALPLIQVDYGVSVGVAQLALSLSMLAIAVSTLVYGPLADRFGRRPVVLAGLGIFLAGSAACAVAPSIELLVLGRIVQAVGSTAGLMLSRAIVRDVYPQEKVAGVLAAVTIGMVVAPMVAPAIGGALSEAFGWRSIFAFGGAVGLAVVVLTLLNLAETGRHPEGPGRRGLGGMLSDFALLFRSPAFNGYTFGGAFGHSAFFCFFAGAPYLMVNGLGLSPFDYGLYYAGISLAFIVGSAVAARWSERLGSDRMIFLGSAISLSGAGLLLALAVAGIFTPLSLVLPTSLALFGMGPIMANLQAGSLGVHPQVAGTASGLIVFLQMGTGAVFAQLVGMAQDGTPVPMAAFMLVAVALTFASFLVAWRANRLAAAPGAA